MLLHLFSSRTRVKLLSIFLLHADQDYFVRELTRITSEQINSVRRELDNLESVGILESHLKNNKKYYHVNKTFLIIEELTSIFNRLSDDRYDLVQGVAKTGDIDVLALSDTLNSVQNSVELVIVGNIKNKEELKAFIEHLEQKYKKEIHYLVITQGDFSFRHKVHDKFLVDFFLQNPYVLIDKLKFSW